MMKYIIVAVVSMVTMEFTMFDSSFGADALTSDRLLPENQEGMVLQLTTQWKDLKELLLNSLGSNNPQIQFSAAYLLGLYRYAEAADSLAAQIAMESKSIEQSREALWGQYPAVEALIRIGKPSVPAMLRNLETSEDEHVRGLSARVIFYVEGPDLAKIVVENAIEKQTDEAKRARLRESLPLVRGGEYKKPS